MIKYKLLEYRKLHPKGRIGDKELIREIELNIINPEISLMEKAAILVFGFKPKCHCGNDTKFVSGVEYHFTEFGSWRKSCSYRCGTLDIVTANKKKQTNLERYGVAHHSQNKEVMEKFKQTNLERYGVAHPSQNKEIREKVKQTNLNRYGVDHPMKNLEIKEMVKQTNLERYGVDYGFSQKEIQNKIKETNLERYGVDNPTKNKEIQNKIKETNIERYGVENVFQNETIKNKVKQTNIKKYNSNSYNKHSRKHLAEYEVFDILNSESTEKLKEYILSICHDEVIYSRKNLSNKLGVHSSCVDKWMRKINLNNNDLGFNPSNISNPELELFEFINSLNVNNIIQSDRNVLNGKELDIYIPDYNLAVEFNGIYWHSESMGRDSNYHIDKTNICSLNEIQLLHIYDTEWNDPVKQEIWKSIIKSKLGLISEKIPARKCEFKQISPKQSREFLEVNHLNGFCGAEVHYGLIYNNQIVSVLSIGKSRFNKGEFEIIRFASKINTLVQGGFSKLLKHIDSKYKFNLVTFADRRYSNGSTYRKYFKIETETSPNWYGFDKRNSSKGLKHRFSFQKHKLKELFGSTFDENLTAYENMLNHDFDRIWDAGNFKFSELGDFNAIL